MVDNVTYVPEIVAMTCSSDVRPQRWKGASSKLVETKANAKARHTGTQAPNT